MPALEILFSLPAVKEALLHKRLEIYNPLSTNITPYNALSLHCGIKDRVNAYRTVFLAGGFGLETIKDELTLYRDADLLEKYHAYAKRFFAGREELLGIYADLKNTGRYQTADSNAFYAHLSGVAACTGEKIVFALSVFAELGLIEMKKSDRIQFIIKHNRQKEALNRSETYTAFEYFIHNYDKFRNGYGTG